MNSEGLGPSKKMLEDRSVLRWGGLAGLLSAGMTVLSLLTIVAFSTPLFVSVQPEDICGPSCYVGASLQDFPASRAALMTHHAFYVLTIMLIAILVVSLYRVLSRESSRIAPALSGFAIGMLRIRLIPKNIDGCLLAQLLHLVAYPWPDKQKKKAMFLVS